MRWKCAGVRSRIQEEAVEAVMLRGRSWVCVTGWSCSEGEDGDEVSRKAMREPWVWSALEGSSGAKVSLPHIASPP